MTKFLHWWSPDFSIPFTFPKQSEKGNKKQQREEKMPYVIKEGQTTIPPCLWRWADRDMGFGLKCRREPRVACAAAAEQEAEVSRRIFQLYEPFLILAKPEACTGEGRVSEMYVTVQSSDELDEETWRPLARSRMLKWQVRERIDNNQLFGSKGSNFLSQWVRDLLKETWRTVIFLGLYI